MLSQFRQSASLSIREGLARFVETRVRLPRDGSELTVFGRGHVLPTYVRAFHGEEARDTRVTVRLRLGPWDRAIAAARARSALTVIHGRTPPEACLADALRVPRFVRLRISILGDLQSYAAALPSLAKRDIARVRSAALERRVSRDLGWLRHFKERYHDPAVRHRHGKSGLLLPFKQMKAAMERNDGGFVQVMKDGRCIAAALTMRRRDTYHGRAFGWLDGEDKWLRLGAMCGVYWFMIQRAHELGCTSLDLDGSAPFLTDGLLAYKSKWGARLVPGESTYPVDHLLLNPVRPGWQRFIESHPIIAWGPDKTFEAHSLLPPEAYGLRPWILEGIQRWRPIVPPPGAA